ncbi:MAG: hypothetical protein KatS3mg111_1029 [Pirellulaceae bacterium]|nr:MAG: hypothetical protein KatS3mg111_1029 [Pirellulaceae bacterium]
MDVLAWNETDTLPKGFLDAALEDVPTLFSTPTLIHLPGPRRPLFVSILLHGNEDAGLLAMQEVLRRHQGRELPRGLSLFVGNVEACRYRKRYLPHQVDFNRAWPGSELPPSPIHRMLQQVTNRMVSREVFASIDIHNNTGKNPVYGCICSCASRHVYLASMFSTRIIYFIRPRGVQTQAFMAHCPAVTLECGQPGDRAAASVAADFIERLLYLEHLHPPAQLSRGAIVYHTVARISVHDHCSIGFAPQAMDADIVFRSDLDTLNFRRLPAGETLARLNNGARDRPVAECLIVHDEHGNDVTNDFLVRRDDRIVVHHAITPSMFTRDIDVIRQDCLGYLMQPFAFDHS